MMSTSNFFEKHNPQHLLVSSEVDAELEVIFFTSNF